MAARILNATRANISRLIPVKVISNLHKLKGGRLEKIGLYWRGILIDYREVSKDAITEARARPRKTAIIFSSLGFLVAAWNTNPGTYALNQQLLDNTNRLLLVPDSIRNRVTEQHLQLLQRTTIEGRLHVANMAFFSLLWIGDHDGASGLYADQCSYLKPRYATFWRRLVDVGAFGRWFVLQRKMRDYDVNDDEWTLDAKN